MSMRTLKVLSATTAFVAAASASHAAAAITVSQTTPTVSVDGAFTISNSAVISTTGVGPALTISGTGNSTDAVVGVSASSILRSNSVTGTISLGADTEGSGISGTLTINNAGSIINTLASGAAISLTALQADEGSPTVVINNTGTISGSIQMGNATGGNTLTNTGGTITGAIVGGDYGDVVTINGGTMTGNINLGAGSNELTVSGTTLNGSYTGAGGADIVTLVDAGVSGTMTFGSGTDKLYVSGTTTFTTKGNITGLEVLGVSGTTMNLNHAVTGGTTPAVTTAADGTLNINDTQTFTGGTITNNGTLNITSGTTTTANYVAGTASSTLGFTIVSNTNAGNNGKLVLSTSGADLTDTSLTVTFGADAGFIASGTTFTLVDGGNTSVLQGALIASNTGVYRLSTALANTNRDVILTVGRVSTSSVVGSQSGKAIANVLDVLGSTASGTLHTVQGLIGQQSTAAGVDRVVESLAPNIDGVGAASVGVTQATGNQVSNRLASLRGNRSVVTGDALSSNHFWVEGFGNTVNQDDKGGNKGYDATGGGMTFGVDTDTLMEGMTTGASFSYGQSNVDSNASGGASTDISSYVATLYGSRVLDQGIFVNGQLGLGYNNYESERTVLGVGTAKGDFDGLQGTAKLEAGKDFGYQSFTLTPLAGVQYTYLNMDSYTETGAGGANLTVDPEDMNALDLSVGGQAAYTMPLSNGGTFKPSVHAKYVYMAGDEKLQTTSRFSGGGAAFNTTGVKADRSSVNLGAGLLLTTAGGVDFSVNYDADIRDSLTGHAGQLKARWAF